MPTSWQRCSHINQNCQIQISLAKSWRATKSLLTTSTPQSTQKPCSKKWWSRIRNIGADRHRALDEEAKKNNPLKALISVSEDTSPWTFDELLIPQYLISLPTHEDEASNPWSTSTSPAKSKWCNCITVALGVWSFITLWPCHNYGWMHDWLVGTLHGLV